MKGFADNRGRNFDERTPAAAFDSVRDRLAEIEHSDSDKQKRRAAG